MLLLLALACDLRAPFPGEDPGESSAGTQPPWGDRVWEGASTAVLLRLERVALSPEPWTDNEGDDYMARTWVLGSAADGATEADAVASGALCAVDVLGDLDGDGLAEWLGEDGYGTGVFPGAATGGLAVAYGREWLGPNLAIGSPDLDGDGLPDLLGVVFYPSERGVWSGTAPGAAPVATLVGALGAGVQDMRGVGDVDGDGFTDLVFGTCCDGAHPVVRLGGPLAGSYSAADAEPVEMPEDTAESRATVALGDTDGDGRDDFAVVVLGEQSGARIAVYSDGGELSGVIGIAEVPAMSLRSSGDLDGDGRSDLALRLEQQVWILKSPVEGGTDLADAGTMLDVLGLPTVGDVDGDGIADLMVGQGTFLDAEEPMTDEVTLVGLGPF